MIIRVVDTETCGLPPDNAQIVEVATVDLVAKQVGEDPNDPASVTWERGKMWSSLVNPGRSIPPEASAVHHITDEMVKDALTYPEIAGNIAGADVYAAHNVKFDRECLKLNGATGVDEMRWICTYKCGVMLFPECANHKNQTLRYYLKLKLADPAEAIPHRAAGDAYVTAALLRTFLRRATVEEMVEISAHPILLPKFTFGKHAMTPLQEVPLDYLSWIVGKGAEFDEDVVHTAKHYLAENRP